MSKRTDHAIAMLAPEEAPEHHALQQIDPIESSTIQYVLFVSAKTLSPSGASYNETIDPKLLHDMGVVDDEIPGREIPEKEIKSLREIRRLRSNVFQQRTQAGYQAELDELKNQLEKENE